MKLIKLLFLWSIASFVLAHDFSFSKPKNVVRVAEGKFIHLDSSGRRNVAVSGKTVAVVWEDNHSGKPTVYVSFYRDQLKTFTKPKSVSGDKPGFDPTIVAIANNRFVVAWEEGGRVWARLVGVNDSGVTQALGQTASKQVSLASDLNTLIAAAWTEKVGVYYHVYYSKLTVKGLKLTKFDKIKVAHGQGLKNQLYPAVLITPSGSLVGWEDRSLGVTRLHYSFSVNHSKFTLPTWINARKRDTSLKYGKGTGAMRIAFAGDNHQFVAASWLDKRNFTDGYDVYTAFSHNAGKQFGKNLIAQDMLGENTPQWHAAVAVNPKNKTTVAIWDDNRDGTSDIWYSVYRDGKWSDDIDLPGASGSGKQAHPSIVFDQQGRLHAVWIDRNDNQSILRYVQTK